MLSFTILPVKGIKNDVPPDDPTMFEFITEAIARTHCADSDFVGYHNTYVGRYGAANKTGGRTLFLSSDATVSGTLSITGLYQHHYPQKNTLDYNYLAVTNGVDEGHLYTWLSGGAATMLSDGAGSDNLLLGQNRYSQFLDAGEFLVVNAGPWASFSPYCVQPGDPVAVSLIGSGDTHGFFYMEYFKNRFFGAYTNVAYGGGDEAFDIRYSNLNPTLPDYSASIDSTVEFPSANQLIYPEKELMTGLKSLNRGRLFAYSENSISEIKYFPSYATPFSINKTIQGFGAVANDSIVEAAGVHFFFDKQNGFCGFNGYDVKIISNDIQDTVDDIDPILLASSYWVVYTMPGEHIKANKEIVWSVSENGTANTYLLYYNYITGSWRKETLAARAIAAGFKANYDNQEVLMLANDADVYYTGINATDAGSAYASFRIEPVLNFSGMNKSLILELWFNSVRNITSGLLDVWYRGGDTVGEVEGASWSAYGSLNLLNPDDPVIRKPSSLNTNNRYHQIKWGTDASSDLFSIREIEFKYVQQGRY